MMKNRKSNYPKKKKKRIYLEEKARLEAQKKAKEELEFKQKGIGCLVMIGIVIVVWLLGKFICTPPKPESPTSRDNICVMAELFMEKYVLKAPASAKFPMCEEFKIKKLGDNTFLVSSYVDAQNSFGAMIRTHFKITLKYLGKKKWKMLNVSTVP